MAPLAALQLIFRSEQMLNKIDGERRHQNEERLKVAILRRTHLLSKNRLEHLKIGGPLLERCVKPTNDLGQDGRRRNAVQRERRL